jgi:DNA-binding NarL/FixJ family response regulator
LWRCLLQVKKALKDNDPYDLLISDLSFKIDHRQNRLTCGDELIEAVKKIQPHIKIIVFSIEDKSYRIKSLFNNLGINAYVSKGRNSIPELQNAVETIYRNDENQIALGLNYTLNDKSLHEIEAMIFRFEVTIKRIHPRRNFKGVQKYGNNT